MRYVGENCPYCGVTFSEQDDVVVCPECATPHHRVCWFAHGECANTDKHGDFVWKKSAGQAPVSEPEPVNQARHSRSASELDIVCPDCGTASPNGTLRCPECGAVLIPFANPTGEPPLAQFRPDFDPNENIRGLKSGDIALFCRTAGASYIKKFRRKFSWNWAALLTSPFWFFYRKLYKAGAVFITVFIALNLLLVPAEQYFYNSSAPLMAEIQEMMEPYVLENEQEGMSSIINFIYGRTLFSDEGYEVLNKFIQNNNQRVINELLKPMLPMYLIGFLMVAGNVVAALLADRLYYKKACIEIKRARTASKDERAVQLELFRRGGTNIFLGAGAYLLCNMLLTAASYFILGIY